MNSSDSQKLETLQHKVEILEANLEQAQEHIETLEAIQQVACSITSQLNLEPLLQNILAAAVRVLAAAAGSLLLVDKQTDELIFAVVEGGGGKRLEGRRMPRTKGLAGWVASHQKPLIVEDVEQDHRYYEEIARTFEFRPTSLLCVPMISHNRLIGVLQVVHSRPNAYFDEVEQELLTIFATHAAIAIENARLYQDLKAERDKLLEMEYEVRKELARDLHDGPTQFVAAMIMSLEFAKELVNRSPAETTAEIEQSLDLARKILKQLRTLLFDLRPVILETQGLVPALEHYTERLEETDDLDIDLTITQTFERLTPKAEMALFAIIQEGLNNAKKHARASKIKIELEPDFKQDLLRVTVQDNGTGFDVEAVEESYDTRGSLGMINMQERVDAVNGVFSINSEVGQGTKLWLTLPLSENRLDNTE